MFKLKRIVEERGIATFVALMLMVMMTLIGLAVVRLADDEITIAGNERNEMSAFYAAEAGLERAAAAMQYSFEATGAAPATLPSGSETINSCVAAYTTTDLGAPVSRTLRQGILAGMTALVKTYRITSTGTSNIDRSRIVLTEDFESCEFPVLQFAIFYDNDLEITGSNDLALIGRVHSNSDLWIQTNNGGNLQVESFMTAAGHIRHGVKGSASTGNGDVFVKDASGVYQPMRHGGTWLDSDYPNWYDSASSRWGGRVQDSAFGQGRLNPPLVTTGDFHNLIERASGNPDSYENRAQFKIIDGVALAKVGASWVNVSALLPAGTITARTFYDEREAQNVNVTDVDISKLKTSTYYPVNRVIYSSDHRSGFNATRLVNGSSLGYPLSFVCENPLYILGNFNTVTKKPCLVAGDAVTFLSNGWLDANSTLPKANRVASATTVNCCFMTGNTNTTSTYYNGGAENLPRFLENWSGKSFIWRGSMINLWNSQQAVGLWSLAFYDPPIRNWAFDTDLNNPALWPPESPRARVFSRGGWVQQFVGYMQQ